MINDTAITACIPKVKAMAKHFNLPSQLDDLAGAGMLALVKAGKIFDPSMKNSFWSFAKHRVKGAMGDHLRWSRGMGRGRSEDACDIFPLDDYLDEIGNDGQANRAMLRDALQYYLHPVEEWVVLKRYFDKTRMDDIASELGFKLSRVSQIHSNAINKLRVALVPSEVKPQEEDGRAVVDRANLLQVVKKMMWDEWGVEVYK